MFHPSKLALELHYGSNLDNLFFRKSRDVEVDFQRERTINSVRGTSHVFTLFVVFRLERVKMLTLYYSASKDLSALDAPVDAASALYQRDLVRIMAEINFINGEVKPTDSFLKSFQLLAF